MRYTAKARMLSFNFLNDDVVYGLPAKQGLLLAGMIARADNLGRMPGEPDVLLSFLFYPRTPRPDMMSDDVYELLTRLTCASPPVVHWYWVKGVRYVQFATWTKHQSGIRQHNLRSTYPGPEDEGAEQVPVSKNMTLPIFDKQDMATPAPAIDMGALVKSIAAQHTVARAIGEFDPGAVIEWCQGRKLDQPGALKFAGWLWNTGTKNMRHILAILEHMDNSSDILSPYAYFAPEGKAREAVIAKIQVASAIAEHAAEEKANKEFLKT